MNNYKELIKELRNFSKEIELDNQIYDIPYGIYHEEILDKAADAIRQLVKERDTAIHDLDMAVNGQETLPCYYCKNISKGCYCWNEDEGYRNWEWRGSKNDA